MVVGGQYVTGGDFAIVILKAVFVIVSAAVMLTTSPCGSSPLRAGAAPSSAPNPPKMTLMIERFIALHMMYERIAPLDPTNAPVMIKRSLVSMKPAAAAAHPE